MKKTFLLFSMILCGLCGYAQVSLTPSSSTVENGATVTVTASGEMIHHSYRKNSIQFVPLGVITEPSGLRVLMDIKDVKWIQDYDQLWQKPSKFSFKITNGTDKTVLVRIPFKGVLQDVFDPAAPTIVNENYEQFVVVTVKPTNTQPTTYNNVAKSQAFTKAGCPAGTEGSQVTYSVPAGKYSGSSQSEADGKAQNDINTNGQGYANNNGQCLTMYYNTARTANFTRNNCPPNSASSELIPFTIQAGRFKATSQTEADRQALNALNSEGQANANTTGTCVKAIIYAKLVRKNAISVVGGRDQNGNPATDGSMRSDRADYYIELYSDAALTIPFNAINLTVNVKITKTTSKEFGMSVNPSRVETTTTYRIVSGNSKLLESNFYGLYADANTKAYNGSIELTSGDYIITY